MFRHPKPFIEFVLEHIASSYDINNPLQKEKALNEMVEFIKTLSLVLQDEYKNYIAALLNISPSRVILSKKYKNSNLQNFQKSDTKELTIIKTALVKPKFLNTILDYIDKNHFTYHQEEFGYLLEEKYDHPKLMRIMVDDDIKIYENEEELKSELLTFLIKFYEQKLKNLIKKRDVSFKEKSFKIRKYKDIITRLKKGELIIYE